MNTATKSTIEPQPLRWIPTGFYPMGMMYMLVAAASSIMYKNMGLSVKEAALYSSCFGLPYMLRPLWAPIVDMYQSKKFFAIIAQAICVLGILAACISLGFENWIWGTSLSFFVIGFAGATQDIAMDGVYITTLPIKQQAKWSGVQGMCWSFGVFLTTGPLISLTGFLFSKDLTWPQAWRITLLIFASLMLFNLIWNFHFLPKGSSAENSPKSLSDIFGHSKEIFYSFFRKKGIWMMMLFILFSRFSQGFLDKMGPLFLIDNNLSGGLGLSNETLGIVTAVGTIGFTIGALYGGICIAKKGLQNIFMLLCFCINLPNAVYLLLSYFQTQNIIAIISLVSLERILFGFGSVAQLVYVMQQIAPGKFKTSHFAYAMALLVLCGTLTGISSGFLSEYLAQQFSDMSPKGYFSFFVFVMIATIPSFIVAAKAPFHHQYPSKSATVK